MILMCKYSNEMMTSIKAIKLTLQLDWDVGKETC